MPTIVLLGNAAPAHDPDAPQAVTTVELIDGTGPLEAVRIIVDLWRYQSSSPPVFVESEDAGIAALVGAELEAPVGRPAAWNRKTDAALNTTLEEATS